ncbi:hypothetical protein CgunFtcFv8_002212 [Champsocephalus gunnari]|uniref:Uncharacterized protein n=1 Tax=Champsocephalus gunnari TaxID=52237 RepID=A0AAN8CQF7_CHAGU|nr:hypothetical protein CgunFtcFv8_002212 [Champsocephalus gunnari]
MQRNRERVREHNLHQLPAEQKKQGSLASTRSGGEKLPSLVELETNARCSVTGSGCGNIAFTGYLLNGETRQFRVYQERGREHCLHWSS